MKFKHSLALLAMIFICIFSFPLHTVNADNDEPDYILGRPMTEEEIEAQKSLEPKKLSPVELPDFPVDNGNNYVTSNPSAGYAASYNSVSQGYVTPVKDQYGSNWCWAYATTSAMETSLIKNKIQINSVAATSANTDLSEAAMVYYLYNRNCVKDPMGNAVGDVNTNHVDGNDLFFYSGNNIFLAEFLSTNMGIKEESYYTMDDYLEGRRPNTSIAYKNNIARLKNVKYVTNSRNAIKKAIKDYGSVVGLVYYDDTYMNYSTGAYSCPEYETTNHSVNIVGWDDNYSSANFSSESGVDANGAWIVKNSWGETWGDGGYFYLSYYDAPFEPATAIEMQSESAYDNTYFYDGSSSNSWRLMSDTSTIVNVFTSSGRQHLKQVSFEAMSANQAYSIQIYKEVSTASPIDGVPVLTKKITGTINSPGIYTADIPGGIYLRPGEKFSVAVTMNSTDKNIKDIYIGSEETCNYEWFSNTAKVNYGQSFFQVKGYSGWTDAASENWCARIKAYTDNVSGYIVTYRDSSGKYLGVENVAKGGNANLNVLNKSGYRVKVVSGEYTNLTSDSIITVSYSPITYTVTLNARGGTLSKSTAKVKYNNKYGSLPVPKRKGYDFAGWYTSTGSTTKITSSTRYNIVGNQTLYAKWKKVKVAKAQINKVKKTSAKSVKVYINKISNATAYEVSYSLQRNMKKTKKMNTKSLQRTISNLKKGRTYYIRIRAFHKDSAGKPVYGAYSTVKKIKL